MLTTQERFWAKVEKTEGCWNWTAGLFSHGYGQFWLDGTNVPAHRFSYEDLVGPIPAGLVIDHLCRNRICVNPEHLEPVTAAENVYRGAAPGQRLHLLYQEGFCHNGHERSPKNTYQYPSGKTTCRICHKENCRKSYQKRKARHAAEQAE